MDAIFFFRLVLNGAIPKSTTWLYVIEFLDCQNVFELISYRVHALYFLLNFLWMR